jgi:hypothetical protein
VVVVGAAVMLVVLGVVVVVVVSSSTRSSRVTGGHTMEATVEVGSTDQAALAVTTPTNRIPMACTLLPIPPVRLPDPSVHGDDVVFSGTEARSASLRGTTGGGRFP